MNIFSLSGFLNGVSAVIFGSFIYFKNPKRLINKTFGLLTLFLAIWAFGYSFWLLAEERESALLLVRILSIGSTFIPITFLHWVLSLLELQERRKKIIISGYILTFIFILFSFNPLYVKNVNPQLSFLWWPEAGVIYNFYLIFGYLGMVGYGCYELIKSYKKAKGYRREQIKYVLLAVAVGFGGGATNFPLWYGIPLLPFGNFLVFFYPLILSYAIVRYRFMGITVIIRKTTVYLATFLVAVSLLLVAFLSFLKLVRFEVPWHIITFGIFLMSLIVLIFPVLLNFFQNLANKYFFASLYQSERILEDLIKKVPTIINLPQLLGLICKTLKDCFHLNRIGILLYDPKTSNYQALVAEGFHPQNGLTLVRNNFLIRYLTENKTPLAYQELKPILEATPEVQKDKVSAIKKLELHMKKIEASVCCPLISKNELIGILILGPKITGEAYFKGDLEFLENLSYQVSIGLENARLYSEVMGFSRKLKKEVEKATKDLKKAYSKLQKLDRAKSEFISIASHQLRTPLTAIKGFISMILEGSYGELSKKVKDPMREVYNSNERLIKLINNLLNLSKIESGTIEFIPQRASVKDIISSVMQELRFEAKKKNLYLRLEKPTLYPTQGKKLPNILIDIEKIRQVVLNVVDNAIKYSNAGGVTIKVKSQEESLLVEIADTGEGMTKQEISHLFKSFSRGTAGSRLWTEGVGLGLYVSKKFVEMHNGKIWAESPGKGKGSTFYIELPIK